MRFLALACLLLLGASATAAPAPRAAAPTNWLAVTVRTAEGFRIGNPNAPVKLVEYGSRTCPICGRFYAEGGAALKTRYVAGGKVSWEFRDLPVHPQDIAVSTLGMCVSTRNFFAVLDQMYVRQNEFNDRAMALSAARWEQLQALPVAQSSRAIADALGYTALLKQAGMTEARIQQCFNDTAALRAFGDRIQAANNIGVDSTPTFFLNGRRLNAVTWGQLEPELKAAGG